MVVDGTNIFVFLVHSLICITIMSAFDLHPFLSFFLTVLSRSILIIISGVVGG